MEVTELSKVDCEKYFTKLFEVMEEQKRVMPTLNDNTEWLEEIHLKVANRLQTESEKNGAPSAEISGKQMEEIIRQYIDENKDEYYEKDADQKVGEFLKCITDRICFLGENRENYYSFSIRSMQEFFAGTSLVKGVKDSEAVNNIRRIAYSSYWRNALLFAFGYIELEKKYLETEKGKVRQLLPNGVLPMMLGYDLANESLKVKQYLFLQYFYGNSRKADVQKKFGIDPFDNVTVRMCLTAGRFSGSEINVTDSFHVYIPDSGIEPEQVRKFVKAAEQLELECLRKLAEFRLAPTYQKYRELEALFLKEDGYLVEQYKRGISWRVAELKETEFLKYFQDRNAFLQSLREGNIRELMQGEERFIAVIKEANRRKKVSFNASNAFGIVAVLMASKYRTILLREVPELLFADTIQDVLYVRQYFTSAFYSEWTNSIIAECVNNVVESMEYVAQDNNYLHLLLWLLLRSKRFSFRVRKEDVMKLKRISFKNEKSKLVVALLGLCAEENEKPDEVVGHILASGADKRIAYAAMVNLLRNCAVKNHEQIWMRIYLLLENESFEERKRLQKEMLKDMMERKENGK